MQKFLAVGEINCGAELLKMLLAVYEQTKQSANDVNVARLAKIFDAIPADKFNENKIIAHTKSASTCVSARALVLSRGAHARSTVGRRATMPSTEARRCTTSSAPNIDRPT